VSQGVASSNSICRGAQQYSPIGDGRITQLLIELTQQGGSVSSGSVEELNVANRYTG
jgi:hypothetical protein